MRKDHFLFRPQKVQILRSGFCQFSISSTTRSDEWCRKPDTEGRHIKNDNGNENYVRISAQTPTEGTMYLRTSWSLFHHILRSLLHNHFLYFCSSTCSRSLSIQFVHC